MVYMRLALKLISIELDLVKCVCVCVVPSLLVQEMFEPLSTSTAGAPDPRDPRNFF